MLNIINGLDWHGHPFQAGLDQGRIGNVHEGEAEVLDAAGAWVLPGLVDMHVHFREPWENRPVPPGETIASGIRAALNGGVIAAACMPNTFPALDNPEIINRVIETAAAAGPVRVLPVAALTLNREGREAVDFEALQKAGAAAFSDDGSTLMDPALMKKSLEASCSDGFAVIAHSLDDSPYAGWVLNDGPASRRLNVPGIPNSAEADIVSRDIDLALETGGHLHVAHVSTREALAHIRRGKEAGGKITCEVCPHHLLLSEDDIPGPDPLYKMSPPLRSPADREAMVAALAEGLIDVIASDHAPHPPETKTDFLQASCGITGIETMLPLIMTELVRPGLISLERALDALSIQPARILGLEAANLEPGSRADCILFAPETEWDCSADWFRSASLNTPFTGRRFKGSLKNVIINGVPVYTPEI